jgi:hypothetical protein
VQFWTKEEVRAARGVFALPQFREAAYVATLKYGASEYEPGNGVTIGPACDALALSGDPRSFIAITTLYEMERVGKYLESLGYVKTINSWDYLYRTLTKAAHESVNPTYQTSKSGLVWSCIRGLARLGELRSYELILRLYDDSKLTKSLRGNLLTPFSWLKDQRANSLIIKVATDTTADDFYRYCAIGALERMEDDRADTVLQQLSASDPKPNIRNSAEQAIKYREAWKNYRSTVGRRSSSGPRFARLDNRHSTQA